MTNWHPPKGKRLTLQKSENGKWCEGCVFKKQEGSSQKGCIDFGAVISSGFGFKEGCVVNGLFGNEIFKLVPISGDENG